MDFAHETRLIVSTSFMDLMLQFTFPLLGAGFGSMPSLFMPSAIGDVVISTRLPNTPGESVRVVAAGRLGRQSPGSVSLYIDAWHAACGEPVVTMEGFMSRVESDMGADQKPRLPCSKLEWKTFGTSVEDVKIEALTNGHPPCTQWNHRTADTRKHDMRRNERTPSDKRRAIYKRGIRDPLAH